MVDTHYDLLTLALMAKKDNKDIKTLLEPLNKNNVSGVIGNLYFMSDEEMKKELIYPSHIDVLKMFIEAKKELEKYKLDSQILYSIEGCDYIKDINELEDLYKAGLNSILLVWNNENKYGSGNRTHKGLTEEGKQFIKKAIDLGMGIDLSHTNEETFDGIIEEIKQAQKENRKVICYASHSNIKSLCPHQRNLNDRQLEKLKEVGGLLGLVAYPQFLTSEKHPEKIRQSYVQHIIYAAEKMGIERIMLASDNMDFIHIFDTECEVDKPVYEYKNMKEEIKEDLKTHFTEEEIEKIMYKNAQKLFQELKSHK